MEALESATIAIVGAAGLMTVRRNLTRMREE
jgi:hypothetical protein